MLASLGGVSTAYHLTKMLEWKQWEAARIAQAERLLGQQGGTLLSRPGMPKRADELAGQGEQRVRGGD
jgi:hypothetical protein